MKMFTSVLFIAMLALQAKAQVGTQGVPEEMPSSLPTFSEVRELWDKGKIPTEKELEGKWMPVLRAERATSCGSVDRTLYDLEGLVNYDARTPAFLSFGYVTIPGNEFTGKPSIRVFKVKSEGYLLEAQERTNYSVRSKEPQFSFWEVNGAENVPGRNIYVEVSCRLSPKSVDKLICGLKMRLVYPEKFGNGPSCNGTTVLFDGFVKVPPSNSKTK